MGCGKRRDGYNKGKQRVLSAQRSSPSLSLLSLLLLWAVFDKHVGPLVCRGGLSLFPDPELR
jgi:hypothetical protein